MISLRFHIGDVRPLHRELYSQLDKVDSSDIAYYMFYGNIEFFVDGLDLSARWGTVPVVDFAACMVGMGSLLNKKKSAVFEFTEGEGSIFFDYAGKGTCAIHADYQPGKRTIPVSEFVEAANVFSGDMLVFLKQEYPQLFNNSSFLNWYPHAREFAKSH